MNAMDQENRRTLAPLGERDAPVAPIKAALFTANEVRQLVDAFSRKSIVRGRRPKEEFFARVLLARRSPALLLARSIKKKRHRIYHRIRHMRPQHKSSTRQKARLLESNRASGTAHGVGKNYCP